MVKNNIEDYIGKKINNVRVIGKDESIKSRDYNHWIFECSCGNRFSASPSRVLSGHKKSCGCGRYSGNFTHGLYKDEFTIHGGL